MEDDRRAEHKAALFAHIGRDGWLTILSFVGEPCDCLRDWPCISRSFRRMLGVAAFKQRVYKAYRLNADQIPWDCTVARFRPLHTTSQASSSKKDPHLGSFDPEFVVESRDFDKEQREITYMSAKLLLQRFLRQRVLAAFRHSDRAVLERAVEEGMIDVNTRLEKCSANPLLLAVRYDWDQGLNFLLYGDVHGQREDKPHASDGRSLHTLRWPVPSESPAFLISENQFNILDPSADTRHAVRDGRMVLEMAREGVDLVGFPPLHSAMLYHSVRCWRILCDYLNNPLVSVTLESTEPTTPDDILAFRNEYQGIVRFQRMAGPDYMRTALFSEYACMKTQSTQPRHWPFLMCGSGWPSHHMAALRDRHAKTRTKWSLLEQELRRPDPESSELFVGELLKEWERYDYGGPKTVVTFKDAWQRYMGIVSIKRKAVKLRQEYYESQAAAESKSDSVDNTEADSWAFNHPELFELGWIGIAPEEQDSTLERIAALLNTHAERCELAMHRADSANLTKP